MPGRPVHDAQRCKGLAGRTRIYRRRKTIWGSSPDTPVAQVSRTIPDAPPRGSLTDVQLVQGPAKATTMTLRACQLEGKLAGTSEVEAAWTEFGVKLRDVVMFLTCGMGTADSCRSRRRGAVCADCAQ